MPPKCVNYNQYSNTQMKNKLKNGRQATKFIMLDQKNVNIKGGDWTRYNYAEQCSNVYQWNCQFLLLQSNLAYNILSNIQNIKFNNLKKLFLRLNLIESIQLICRIELPALQYIDLTQNQIISLKPLRRAYLPHISSIHVQENKISQSNFPLAELYAPQLSQLSLQYFFYNRININDVRPIVKLQTTKLQSLYFDGSKRIFQKQPTQLLFQRFPKAQIAQQYLQNMEFINPNEQNQSDSENQQEMRQ